MKLPVVIYLPAETTTQTNVRWRDDFGSKARVARAGGPGAEAAHQQRKEFGSKGSRLHQDPEDPNRVWIIFDWDVDGLNSLKASPDAAELFKSAGLKGPPMPVEPVGEFEG